MNFTKTYKEKSCFPLKVNETRAISCVPHWLLYRKEEEEEEKEEKKEKKKKD